MVRVIELCDLAAPWKVDTLKIYYDEKDEPFIFGRDFACAVGKGDDRNFLTGRLRDYTKKLYQFKEINPRGFVYLACSDLPGICEKLGFPLKGLEMIHDAIWEPNYPLVASSFSVDWQSLLSQMLPIPYPEERMLIGYQLTESFKETKKRILADCLEEEKKILEQEELKKYDTSRTDAFYEEEKRIMLSRIGEEKKRRMEEIDSDFPN